MQSLWLRVKTIHTVLRLRTQFFTMWQNNIRQGMSYSRFLENNSIAQTCSDAKGMIPYNDIVLYTWKHCLHRVQIVDSFPHFGQSSIWQGIFYF